MASLGLIVMALVMAVIFVAGVVLVALSRRGRTPYPSCGKCRYDVSGSIGTVVRCPECGQAFAEVGILPPGRGPRSMVLGASGVVLLVIALGCLGTSVTAAMYQRAQTAQAQARMQAQLALARAAQAQAVIEAEAEARQEADREQPEADSAGAGEE